MHKRKLNSQHVRGNRGAVLVEFAIGFLVLFMTMAFVVDMSITYFRFNLLVFASQKVSRRIAVDLGDNTSPAALSSAAQDNLRAYLGSLGVPSSEIGITSADIEIDNGPSDLPADRRCYLHIKGITWKSFSILSSFFQDVFTIRTKTKVLIEDPCFVC